MKQRPAQAHPRSPQTAEPYVASQELKDAVNLAIFLGRPLLLEGEAGSGKSRLAYAVAYELGLPLYPWHVRSTSKAQEGLYTYDALMRLHDVHAVQRGEQTPGDGPGQQADDESIDDQDDQPISRHARLRRPDDPTHYRQLGALGLAFRHRDVPAVVLIDEVDKADIDFPNDLLTVLDDPWSFAIPETGERVRASRNRELRPIVLITSNKEKGNLPAPFLRRCIYHYITFPDDEERLKQIINVHYTRRGVQPPATEIAAAAAARFVRLRRDETGLYKRPGLSEFLDWIEALRAFPQPADLTARLAADDAPPYPGLLFKLRADWQRFAQS